MHLFKQNEQADAYWRIIDRAESGARSKGHRTYYEAHHPIPHSIVSNHDTVLLTAAEHYRAHELLPSALRAVDHRAKMHRALWRLANGRHGVTPKQYETARQGYALSLVLNREWTEKISATRLKRKIAPWNKGKKLTEAHKAHVSKTKRAKPYHPSQEERDRISAKLTGRKIPRDLVERRAAAQRGKKRSDEFRRQQSERMTGKKYSAERVAHMVAAKKAAKLAREAAGIVKPYRPFTDEHRANLSKAAKARTDKRWLGKKHTPETIEKMRAAKLGKKQSKDTIIKKVNSMKEFFKTHVGWSKGNHWYSDGITEVSAPSCPPGFWPGRKSTGQTGGDTAEPRLTRSASLARSP